MGKKYLETKKDSLESSILGVWKTAIEEGDARMDGRTKEYREHRKKLESARVRRLNKEEVDLDEGKMKELHGYIQDGKSAEEIAKIMKLDVKTIKALMTGYKEAWELGTNSYREYLEKLTPGEMDEASARADAKRAMRADPSMKQDPFSKDDAASDEDIKGASKNIIMQMRKAVSMRGNFDVEFLDRKKKKVPVKIAQAVQDKFNSFKKPADKEKFQAQAAKSYNDMLKVFKPHPALYDDMLSILLLTFPRVGGAWGECKFMPKGLPLLKRFSTDVLKSLLEPLDGSKVEAVVAAEAEDNNKNMFYMFTLYVLHKQI